MQYEKKIIMLKETLEGFSPVGKKVNGIARLETDDNLTVLYLSVINLSSVESGDYYLYIYYNRNLRSFPLGKRPTSFSAPLTDILQGGFSMGITFIENDIPYLIAFGGEGNDLSSSDFKKLILDDIIKVRKKKKEIIEKEEIYDDESVATENFYSFDKDLEEKIRFIEGFKFDGRIENNDGVYREQAETGEVGKETDFNQNEGEPAQKGEFNENSPYYETVRKELENVFDTFESVPELERNIEDSKWAKINFSLDKYYVVGVVKINGKEKYICYGVPGRYGEQPPTALQGFCSFLPRSVFDLKGEGYFMMYQDAITGACVKK